MVPDLAQQRRPVRHASAVVRCRQAVFPFLLPQHWSLLEQRRCRAVQVPASAGALPIVVATVPRALPVRPVSTRRRERRDQAFVIAPKRWGSMAGLLEVDADGR